ncbi:MAG: DUF1552 domain-containing protein [Verrucomicrobia bacterium]|nr:DUF1552 domain-containing protein [Verrucomicrobiota bacterium]
MKTIERRSFLRAAGTLLALPLLESTGAAGAPPRRMVFIMTNMGVMPRYFFPTGTGREYEPTPYLELLQRHRERFTVFSGLSHPGVDGQHLSEKSFLSGAPHPAASQFQNTLSVDQWAAEQIGAQTRFASLVLRVGKGHEGTPSTTRDGVPIPPEASPAALYRKLFVQGTATEVERNIGELRKGGSILDFVRDEMKRLEKGLPARDRERLEQYSTSVRELETRLQHAEAWERKPKPAVALPEPRDVPDEAEVEAQTNLMYDTLRLALETDSTRVVSVYLGPLLVTPRIPGVRNQTHALTHHGNDEAKMAELRKIEEAQFRSLAGLLDGLAATPEPGGSLLDRTMVLYGSNLSNANAHDTKNLPILLAGGGFVHGRHLAFDRQRNKPLANLFVTMLQQAGFGMDQFSSSNGTITL